MSSKHEISCWKCHEMTSLEARNEMDGCCWACGEEIDLDDYLIKAMDMRDEHYAALSAVTAERDRLRKDAERYQWLCVEGNWVARMFGKWRAHTGEYGENNPTDWFDSRDAAIDSAMAAKEAGPEHACSGCGAKGWTGNCLECIPY